MTSTKDVLDHHLKCFGEGDLTGILSDYAPGAVLFTPDGPLRGSDAIRPLFQAMFAEFGKPGAAFRTSLRPHEQRKSVLRNPGYESVLQTTAPTASASPANPVKPALNLVQPVSPSKNYYRARKSSRISSP